jgi:hypothetical protein
MAPQRDYAPDRAAGYRRRIVITPEAHVATASLEDDFHHMRVTLRHDGSHVTEVSSETLRAPWNICPAAAVKLAADFTGARLSAAAAGTNKRQNCTHLYDLAVLAAAHAGDEMPTRYDVLVADPQDGVVHAELRRNGETLLKWVLVRDVLAEPAELAGTPLGNMRDWIGRLDGSMKEAARILQWATFVAHGRTIPLDQQSDASRMPPNCYTFQPDRAAHAVRTGLRRDFSQSGRSLLVELE